MKCTATLLSTIKLPLNDFHVARVERIDAEDFSGVRRKVREDFSKMGQEVDEDYLDEGILALKQYYAVALLDPANEHAVSDVIDPFWHAHILHTANYIAFGNEVFGQYIPHEPLDHADASAMARVARLYRYTSTKYRNMFSYINDDFYPVAVPAARQCCTHSKIHTPEVCQHGFFPSMALAA